MSLGKLKALQITGLLLALFFFKMAFAQIFGLNSPSEKQYLEEQGSLSTLLTGQIRAPAQEEQELR